MTAGRKPSRSASAWSIRRRTASTAAGFFRSTAMLRRPREGGQEGRDRAGRNVGQGARVVPAGDLKQPPQMNFTPHQRNELFGGQPYVVDNQRARLGGTLEKPFDLGPVALGAGLPEHLPERRKA